jgi:hypothetical protein
MVTQEGAILAGRGYFAMPKAFAENAMASHLFNGIQCKDGPSFKVLLEQFVGAVNQQGQADDDSAAIELAAGDKGPQLRWNTSHDLMMPQLKSIAQLTQTQLVLTRCFERRHKTVGPNGAQVDELYIVGQYQCFVAKQDQEKANHAKKSVSGHPPLYSAFIVQCIFCTALHILYCTAFCLLHCILCTALHIVYCTVYCILHCY